MDDTTEEIYVEPYVVPAAERERIARFLADAQERWTKLIRRRRMEKYGDPDSTLPVWPVKPPDVPHEELQRIHELIEKEFGCWESIERDVAP